MTVAFLFTLEAAMRVGDIAGLKPEDINGPVATLPMTKNASARKVPLSKRALELFSFLPKEVDLVFDLKKTQLDSMFRNYRDRAGVEDLTFHDTRHEAITR